MAGLIPQSFIDDLLARVDILDVVEPRVRLRKTGKNYAGLCPFHKEKSPSFTVEPERQFYYCFGCGAGGNALGFVMNYENLDFPQAIEILAAGLGLEVPREEGTRDRERRERGQDLYGILDEAARWYREQLRRHPQRMRAVNYLKQRGLSGEIARDYGLGFAPPGWENLLGALGGSAERRKQLLDSGLLIENLERNPPHYDRFRDRIIYPIRDSRGRVIAFGGRVLGDDKPKYLNSPETPVFRKGEELYGLYEARRRLRRLERVLIVEGYMDVIALAQHGIHNAVATLGTATSAAHLKRLFRLTPEVVFCFDGDAAGREAAWRALEQVMPLMEDGRAARFLFLPEGEDPDTQVRKAGNAAFLRQVTQASPLSEFFFQVLRERNELGSLEGKARLASQAMPLIRELPPGALRELLTAELARLTGLSAEALAAIGARKAAAAPAPAQPGGDAPPAAPEPAPRPAARSAPGRPRQLKLSPCMRAVNLILRRPAIVEEVDPSPELAAVESPDIGLLLKVVELARRHPASSTPELLGRLYGTEQGSQLVQLLAREQITPEEGLAGEFAGIVAHLVGGLRRRRQVEAQLEAARRKLQSRQDRVQGPGSEESEEQID